ncbi:MAG: acyl-ACP desaturase [Acidimicrobiia bacterium]|nr:acyl-ACP desaturase [Acidimicrobiia bacterium]
MAKDEAFELAEAVTPAVERLMAEHRERREHWYAHEYVPWEQGRNFVTEPWVETDANLSPEVRTALVLNLLTEDNLPYYHAEIEKHLPEGSPWQDWNRLWTAEEGQHAIALRSYLLTSRNCDPRELEDDRFATMEKGYEGDFENPIDIFVYTSAQELATRVSHRNAGKLADDKTAYDIMARIATDENHHFMFYRGVVTAMLKENPSAVLASMYRVLANFQMPGTGIPGFLRRAVDMAKSGVYNLRLHNDRVVSPLLRDWDIGSLTDLTGDAAAMQEKIMELPARLLRRAEAFDRRFGTALA